MTQRMHRRAARKIAGCLFLLLASACTDVGDSSSASGDSSAGQTGDDTGAGSDSQAGADSTLDSALSADAFGDSAQAEAGSDDAGPEVGDADADGTVVSSTPDSSPADAAGDATVDAAVEAGAHDAAVDATADAAVDAGIDASHDASGDVGPDAPADARQESSTGDGGGPCSGSAGGLCTPTELLFQQHDQGCYDCLLSAGCLDDAPAPISFGDTGHECADVTGDTLVAGKTRAQACLDVISCTLAHASAEPTLAFGYCGTQPTSVSCQTATPGQTGPCLLEEQTGLESTDPNTVLGRYTNVSYGGGMGNEAFQCAISNMCLTCLH
jgi:hypothetical protein